MLYQITHVSYLHVSQQCIISLMICLHHEPNSIAMYQTNTNCCSNQVVPMVQYHQAYAIYECTKDVHYHAPIPQNDESYTCMPNPT
jgi:hypothetical protein